VTADMSEEISNKLAKLLAQQNEFFRKGIEHSPTELREFEQSRARVRELFAQLASKKAA
jgi:hypothetical protein